MHRKQTLEPMVILVHHLQSFIMLPPFLKKQKVHKVYKKITGEAS